MIRYGVIGTGWIADSFIDGALLLEEKLALGGALSRDPARGEAFLSKHLDAQRGLEARVYASVQEMGEDPDLDAVYIASPNALHYEQAKALLLHDKHVICEKPICTYPAQLRELQSLAKERGLVYMEAIMMLHQPQLSSLKAAVGELGRIYTAHLDFSQLSSKYGLYREGKNPNIFNPAMETGALQDLGIYCIYLALCLFGEPEDYWIQSQFLESGADCCGDLWLRYQDKLVSISYSKVGQGYLGSEIIGDEGTLTIDLLSQLTGMTLHRKDGSSKLIFGEREKEPLMGEEAKDFVSYIEKRPGARTAYEDASRYAMMVCTFMEKLRNRAGIVFGGENGL